MAKFSSSKVRCSEKMEYSMSNGSFYKIKKGFFLTAKYEEIQPILWESLQILTEHYIIVPTQAVAWLYRGVNGESQGNVVKKYIKPAVPMMMLKYLSNCNNTFIVITEPAQKPDQVSVTTFSGNNIDSIKDNLKSMESKIKNVVNIEIIKHTHFARESEKSERRNFVSIFQAICFLMNIPKNTPIPQGFTRQLRATFNDAYNFFLFETVRK